MTLRLSLAVSDHYTAPNTVHSRWLYKSIFSLLSLHRSLRAVGEGRCSRYRGDLERERWSGDMYIIETSARYMLLSALIQCISSQSPILSCLIPNTTLTALDALSRATHLYSDANADVCSCHRFCRFVLAGLSEDDCSCRPRNFSPKPQNAQFAFVGARIDQPLSGPSFCRYLALPHSHSVTTRVAFG